VLQNWKVLNAFESNGYTIVKFTRKLIIPEDKQNDCDIGKFLLLNQSRITLKSYF